MLTAIKNYIINFRGYKTNRKTICFLVDDYGTIRISTAEALESLGKLDPKIGNNRFNKYDDIASAEDLKQLYAVLKSVTDKNGNPAVCTPMTVVANPDFAKIEADHFQNYHYEDFYQTLAKKSDGVDIKNLWKQGIHDGIFVPEFHGREHLNVRSWMEFLRKQDKNVMAAFKTQSIGMEPADGNRKGYMAAFDVQDREHLAELNVIAREGLDIFETLFGYRSVFFTPSALIHNDGMHEELKNNGIRYIDMARSRTEPTLNGTARSRYHYMGESNKLGQRYITRNVMFEPNKDKRDWVKSALSDIETAFKFGKPAVISSHRVNFVGGKDEENRDKGLKSLKSLLEAISKKWPDAEFVTVRDLFK